MSIEEQTGAPKWEPVEGLFELIKRAREGKWWYFNNPNPRVKYVNVRIDMRDGNCVIRDDQGKFITLAQLQEQK